MYTFPNTHQRYAWKMWCARYIYLYIKKSQQGFRKRKQQQLYLYKIKQGWCFKIQHIENTRIGTTKLLIRVIKKSLFKVL